MKHYNGPHVPAFICRVDPFAVSFLVERVPEFQTSCASMTATPGQPFLLVLPNNAGLLGTQMSVQGLTLDWAWGLHLTNALDITVGTH